MKLLLKVQQATLNHEIAILSRQIQLPHQYPADRFITATTLHYNITLITVDRHLVKASWVPTLR